MKLSEWMYEWDNPQYKEMIDVLEKAANHTRKYSGCGIDVSDIDLAYLYAKTFARIAALEAKLSEHLENEGDKRFSDLQAENAELREEIKRLRELVDECDGWSGGLGA